MRTTIDGAGRVVIPKAIRDELGITRDQEAEVTLRDGRIEITPVTRDVRLIKRGGFLAAEPSGHKRARLSTDDVRALLERLRR